jgi:hypothetical protein
VTDIGPQPDVTPSVRSANSLPGPFVFLPSALRQTLGHFIQDNDKGPVAAIYHLLPAMARWHLGFP